MEHVQVLPLSKDQIESFRGSFDNPLYFIIIEEALDFNF